MNNAPGKTFIKVTSIIYVVFGSLGLLFSIIGLGLMGGLIQVASSVVPETQAAFGGFSIFAIMTLLSVAFSIFVGVMGIMYCNTTEKAQLLLIIGAVDIILRIIQTLSDFSLLGLIFYALPVFYVLGAIKNKNA